MDVSEVVGLVISTGFLSAGGAYYLMQRFMDIQVQKVIMKYESELAHRTEALKTDLSIYAHEQTVGLSRLEELRAEAIQGIYALAIKWQEQFLEITQPNLPRYPDQDRQLQRMVNWSQNLVRTGEHLSIKVRDTAIFFDEESYHAIARYGKLGMDLAIDFYDVTFEKWDKTKDPNYGELFESFDTERAKLRETAKGEFEKAQRTLIIEFRKLMKADRVMRPKS